MQKIFIVGLVIFLISGGAFYLGKNSPKDSSKQVACTKEAKVCPDGSAVGRTGPNCEFAECPQPSPASSDETANWKTYTNSKYGFQIKYPTEISSENWVYEELKTIDGSIDHISFGSPSSKQGGYIWGVELHSNKIVEDLIKEQGSQFSDRKESREDIVVNGRPALLVTVTTDQFKGWILKNIYTEKDKVIFVISNGAADTTEFDSFYNTFKFLQ